MYGATEASDRLAYLEPEELKRMPYSIGKAIPNVELFVADNESQHVHVGEAGELIGRGPNISNIHQKSYVHDPGPKKPAVKQTSSSALIL